MGRLKQAVKRTMERFTPELMTGIRSITNRRYFRVTHGTLQREVASHIFKPGVPISVKSGPFQGMRYIDGTVWGSITPKWLGSYELELHPVVEEIARGEYQTVIDVGCAEGYYAVGLATRLPQARVFAFDTDFISRGQVRKMIKMNQVENRVEVGRFCSADDLNRLTVGKTLVFCDIEGFEVELLNPASAQALCRADVLVEVHEKDSQSKEVEQTLVSRFFSTHDIRRLAFADRDYGAVDGLGESLNLIPPPLRDEAVSERRGTGMVWLWMTVKKKESETG